MSPQARSHAFSGSKLKGASSSAESVSNLNLLEMSKDSSAEMHLQASNSEEEYALLLAENAELHNRLEEADQLLQAAATSEETWLERQKEYELLLEEKSEVIRDLHHKIQQLQDGTAGPSPARAAQDKRAHDEIEEHRRQLAADEEALMGQMRQMEISLSRDRAELARQRNEIQRMHADLTREIEAASRDSGLRERLASLRSRHQDNIAGKKIPTTAVPQPAADIPPPDAAKKSGGLFRRIFGGDAQ